MNKLLLGGAAIAALAVPAVAQMAMHHDTSGRTTRADTEAKVRAHFKAMDANHDGSVTREEADGAMAAMTAERRGQAFDRIDTNHDGSISREEFAARRAAASPERMAMRMERRDTDGKRGAGDHRMMMMRHGGAAAGFGMFVMADTDKNGRVTEQEAVDATLSRFDIADANHDGTLSDGERDAAMAAMHAEMRAPPAPPAAPAR